MNNWKVRLMKMLVNSMQRRLELLQSAEKKLMQQLEKSPQGRLRIAKKKGHPCFYHVVSGGGINGTYLKTNQVDLARDLAQKDYLTRLNRSIQAEKKVIGRFLENYPKYSPEDVFAKLIPARKELVTPLLAEDEDAAKIWMAEPFVENPYLPEEKQFATKRGELVRSKSEAMIADAYYDMGIPYKYDFPVKVGKGKTKYVDFVLLDVRNGRVFYHEHLGRLDDPEYLHKNMIKLEEYRRASIYTGKNLILTTEIDGCPLDMNQFRKNTAELFGKALAYPVTLAGTLR